MRSDDQPFDPDLSLDYWQCQSKTTKDTMMAVIHLLWLPVILGLFWPDAGQKYEVMIVTGQNNHDWQRTLGHLEGALQDTDLFNITVSLTPPKDSEPAEWDSWRPDFGAYSVVLLAYNGEMWPEAVRNDFEAYVAGGGAVLVQHAANNPFPGWEAFEQMVGLLWRGKDIGHRAYWDEDSGLMRLPPGEDRGAGHGRLHDWQITTRNAEHPIMVGLPAVWLHPHDELYHGQRGPAEGMNVLATAWSDPESGGTGEHELMVWWTAFGEGRVLTLLPGHLWGGQEDDRALRCVGFRTLLQRSTEWLASGEVALPAPDNFPTATEMVVLGED